MNNETVKWVVVVVVAAVIAIGAYSFLTAPDRRTTTERVGDAVRTLPDGADKAGQQLQDRTPSQRIGDAVRGADK